VSFPRPAASWCSLLFHAAVFTGAFLVFAIQPAAAKILLPGFGGSASVWSAVLLFFQAALLAGYGYSWLLQRLAPWAQAALHLFCLMGGLLACAPGALWGGEKTWNHPLAQIFGLLALGLGPAFCLLSSTSPLLQQWATWVVPGSPYRFYATSNAGSLLALLLYPVLIEPQIGLQKQVQVWFILVGFAWVLVLACGVLLAWSKPAGAPFQPAEPARPGTRPREWLAWIGWPMLGSILLMGFSNYLCRDIASIPFLWIAPLAVYLLTFICCFAEKPWYPRRAMLGAFMVFALLYSIPWTGGVAARSWVSIPVNLLALFFGAMIAHGETVRAKPEPGRLTLFYFALSLGGALGGCWVNFGAPLVFTDYWELPLAVAGLATWVMIRMRADLPAKGARLQSLGWMVAQSMVVAFALIPIVYNTGKVLMRARSFYGTIRVLEEKGVRLLRDGRIEHGVEYLDPARAREPLAYYGSQSGSALVFEALKNGPPLKVALIGLGAGSQTAYARPGDEWHVFELNPDVVGAATGYFQYLRQPQGVDLRLVVGDGRKELRESGQSGFDVVVLDAFSSDAIPVHLLTEQAFALYLERLKPEGHLIVHISNRHVDLKPLMRALADRFRLEVRLVASAGDGRWVYPAAYAIFRSIPPSLPASLPPGVAVGVPEEKPGFRLWTDDYSNLAGLLFSPF
jgi:protein-L-isoaspartate O-methyltransferase